MVPWGLPGRSQSLLWQPPGSLKAFPGSPCASCLAPTGTPCEPLAPSRHCLGASKSYLGSLGTKHFVLGGLGTPNFIKNQEFVSHAFDLLSLFAITYSKRDFGLKLLVFLIDEMVDLSRARGSFVQSPTLDIHTSPLTDGQGKEILAAL